MEIKEQRKEANRADERILFSLDTDNRITKELDEIIIKNGFAAALIERRTSLDMTQKEMAEKFNVSVSTVKNYIALPREEYEQEAKERRARA